MTLVPNLEEPNLVFEQPTMKTHNFHIDIILAYYKVKYTLLAEEYLDFHLTESKICRVLSTPLMGATLFIILRSNCEFD